MHDDPSRRGMLLSTSLDFEQSVNSYGDDRDAQFGSEQPDSSAKRLQLPIGCVFALRKNQHTVAAIDGFSGIREAPGESRAPGQRKQIQ